MKKLLFAVVVAIVAMSCCEVKESVELRFIRKDGTVTTEVRQLKRVCFEELPEDWSCPLCGAYKSQFEKI